MDSPFQCMEHYYPYILNLIYIFEMPWLMNAGFKVKTQNHKYYQPHCWNWWSKEILSSVEISKPWQKNPFLITLQFLTFFRLWSKPCLQQEWQGCETSPKRTLGNLSTMITGDIVMMLMIIGDVDFMMLGNSFKSQIWRLEAWGGSDDWEYDFEPEILRQQPVNKVDFKSYYQGGF